MIDHEQAQLSLGAYVLGALEAAERSELEQHLEACPACRGELVSFAGLPGLMGRLSVEQARESAPRPVAALRDSTVAAIRAEKRDARRGLRRWRVIAGGGVAAAVAACTALILLLTTSNPPTSSDAAARQELTAATGQSAQGSLALQSKPWGTQVHLVLTELPRSGVFSVRTTTNSGQQSTAATWGATPNGQAELTGATPWQINDIARVDVLTDAGVTVLSSR